jgi:hypothetical protein
MISFAAVTCSVLITSTVALNSTPPLEGEHDSDPERAVRKRLVDMPGEASGEVGVEKPFVGGAEEEEGGGERSSASDAARRSKFVVPRDFVEPDRAEQTMASFWSSRYDLHAGLSRLKRGRKKRGVRDDFACDFMCKFAYTSAAVFLDEPSSRRVY